MDYFLCVIGMVLIVEGLPYVAFPDRMKRLIYVMLEMPGGALRKFGFMLMITGLFLVYMGRT